MQNYELMLVVQGQIPEDLAREVSNKAKSIIDEFKGNVTFEDFWGRRKLAYKINSQEHGYYDVLNFSVDPENIKKIENEIKLIGEVIRYLVVKKVEKAAAKLSQKVKGKEEKVKTRLDKNAEIDKKKKVEKVETKEKTEAVEKEAKEIIGEVPAKVQNVKEKEDVKKETEEVDTEQKGDKQKEEKERLEELDKKINEILKE